MYVCISVLHYHRVYVFEPCVYVHMFTGRKHIRSQAALGTAAAHLSCVYVCLFVLSGVHVVFMVCSNLCLRCAY